MLLAYCRIFVIMVKWVASGCSLDTTELRGLSSVSNENTHTHVAVYPGSFDPLTNGHLDIARRAAHLFDTLVVAVYALPAKNLLFSVDERLQLWQEVIAAEELTNVRVDKFTELTVEYVRSVGGHAIIKGLRSPNDFEAEFRQG